MRFVFRARRRGRRAALLPKHFFACCCCMLPFFYLVAAEVAFVDPIPRSRSEQRQHWLLQERLACHGGKTARRIEACVVLLLATDG